MPTPFQHLTYAWDMLQHPALPEPLRAHPGAFALGHTAGDVQAVSGQPRQETHFYVFPPTGHPRAGAALLEQHPALRDPSRLAPDHAAFVAGYLAHLAWDEVWAWEVYIPCYLETGFWAGRMHRALHHNALRVRLDRAALFRLLDWPALPDLLALTEPHHWLPFVEDDMLRRWRDWLVQQLRDPASVQTLPVFAARMGVLVEELAAAVALQDTGQDAHIELRVKPALERYSSRAFEDAMRIVQAYMAGQSLPL